MFILPLPHGTRQKGHSLADRRDVPGSTLGCLPHLSIERAFAGNSFWENGPLAFSVIGEVLGDWHLVHHITLC